MPTSAKDNLLKRIQSVDNAAQLESLIDKDVMQEQHNTTANLLRKGLGIVAFNILEDFIKSRTIEMFDFINSARVRFEQLPEPFKMAATSGALKGLIYQAGLEKKNNGDWIALIHSEAKSIFSTSQFPYTLSRVSLLSDSSNIGHEDIPEVMRCLDIPGGWQTLQKISNDIGGGTLDLNAAYKNMFADRNKCAHEAGFNYPYTSLETSLNDIVTIASAFDIAITSRCRYIEKQPNLPLSSHKGKAPFTYRFLMTDGDNYREKKSLESSARTIKIWRNFSDAQANLIPKLRSKDECLIFIGRQRRLSDWYF
ncbi:HEPN domain-containing protein [Cronobacter dublinensis]|uniref:HEPN domain-containing protein n=1 Tax=Cronobacter dublinensis TaxID=413497 RepID=UPI001319ED3D|nr:HEPN domain-containing protein [Cronobacter dublinensis]